MLNGHLILVHGNGQYIEAFRRTRHSLLAQTPRDLFFMVLWPTAYSGIAVRLILFAHHKPDCTPLFLWSETENLRMLSKRKEYHVDCRAAKAAKFFLMCKSHIDPDMRIKIPAAMMAKGYSDKESKNRMLQMQVRREVEKIRGLDPPRPPEAVAAAATALLTLSAPPNATRVTLATITPDAPLPLAESARGW
jgi:hypothetical protein